MTEESKATPEQIEVQPPNEHPDPAISREDRASVVRPASALTEVYSPTSGAVIKLSGHGLTVKEAIEDLVDGVLHAITKHKMTPTFPWDKFDRVYGVSKPRDMNTPQQATQQTTQQTATQPAQSLGGGAPIPQGQAPQAVTGGWNPQAVASMLIGEVFEGKQGWKVTNVPGTKYPVRIWPEVLAEAGIDVTTLDIMQQYSLTFNHGEFENNEKGYPRKVTLLTNR